MLDTVRLHLRSLQHSDKSESYLAWLNDAEVQKYTRRRGRTSTMADVEAFIEYSLTCPDFHFAIFTKPDQKHIGNISLNSVDERNLSAELSIMIGDRSAWGQGYAPEAMNVLTRFAFEELKLHRIWVESCNPAFIALMDKLGWPREGVRRDAVNLGDHFVDYIDWAILQPEYTQV